MTTIINTHCERCGESLPDAHIKPRKFCDISCQWPNRTNNASQLIIDYRQSNPNMTLVEIGDLVGVSKERVRQILAKANIETRSTNRIPKSLPNCKNCGKPVPSRGRLYCSNECQHPNGKTKINCHYCDKEIILRSAEYRTRIQRARYIHCSKECLAESQRGRTKNNYRNEIYQEDQING